jgi:hypothetical protein
VCYNDKENLVEGKLVCGLPAQYSSRSLPTHLNVKELKSDKGNLLDHIVSESMCLQLSNIRYDFGVESSGNATLFSLPSVCPNANISVCNNFETTSYVILELLEDDQGSEILVAL